MSRAKQAVSLLAAVLSLAFLPSLQGTIHTVIAADHEDVTIGCMTPVNVSHMEAFVDTVSQYTGEPVETHYLIWDKFTTEATLSTLQGLQVEADDIVIFHYSGHGFHSTWQDLEDPLPSLQFDDQPLMGKRVLQEIQAKHPRLTMVIFDSCNGEYMHEPSSYRPVAARAWTEWGNNEDTVIRNYHRLFLDTDGAHIFTAASPNEYSWIGPEEGSLFTHQLIQSFEEAVKRDSEANWNLIFEQAALQAVKRSQEIVDYFELYGESLYDPLNSSVQHAQYFFFP